MSSDQQASTAGNRRSTFETLESGFNSPRGKWINGFIVALIVINVIAVIIESDLSIFDAYKPFFLGLEVFSVAVFTIEYITRVWSCIEAPDASGMSAVRARLRYMRSPMAIVDLLAFAPYYVAMIFSIDLRFLRLLRLLRLLKLTHYFHGLDLFLDVLHSEWKTIASAVLTVLMLIVIVACLMFLFEHNAQPEAFGNILQSIWWSVVTLTTVGYGDITPVTMGGRILAIFIMLLGVGLVALPAGILAAKFSDELKARRDKLATQIHHALADGTIDHQERQDLDALTEELRISQSRLDDMIVMQKQQRGGPVVCPNCGSKIDASGSG